MKKKHTETQILEKLRLAERLAANGMGGTAIASKLEVSEQTYYRWKSYMEELIRRTCTDSENWNERTRN